MPPHPPFLPFLVLIWPLVCAGLVHVWPLLLSLLCVPTDTRGHPCASAALVRLDFGLTATQYNEIWDGLDVDSSGARPARAAH